MQTEDLQKILINIERDRQARKRIWRILLLGLPALACIIVGIVLTVGAGAIGLVKIVLDHAAKATYHAAEWMLGPKP